MDTRAPAESAEGRKGRDAAIAAARDGGTAAVADAMLPKLFRSERREEGGRAWPAVEGMIRSAPVPGIIGALTAMRERPDSTSLLPTLGDLPVLVVTGEADRIIPADASREMAEEIPGARFRRIAGAGHLPPVERPEETTEVIREFLAEALVPPPPRAG